MPRLALLLALAALLRSCPGDGEPEAAPGPVEAATPVPGTQGRSPEGGADPVGSAASRETCCAACALAARTDPAGMDLSLLPCADYADHEVGGQRVMTPACAAWFGSNPLMVQDCR